MTWQPNLHPRDPADGEFADSHNGWARKLSDTIDDLTPHGQINAGQRRIAQRFGVELPEATAHQAPGAPAETDQHTGAVRYNPAEAGRLERYRHLGVNVGGALGYDVGVWHEAGVHEGAHAIAHHRLTNDQQIEALRAGARAAGLPEPASGERIGQTYGWASKVENESLVDYQPGTGAVSRSLSRYASMTSHEALAEALTEYVLSPRPRPFAQAVGDYVHRVLAAGPS